MRWQEIRNLFHILRFDQNHKTSWRLTTWTDCENGPELDQQRPTITREGAIAAGMGSRVLVDRESLTVRARCHSGRGWQPKPRGVRRSCYAVICEAGAWERGSGSFIRCVPKRELGNEEAGASYGASPSGSLGTRKAGASYGAFPSGSFGTRKALTGRARCHSGRGWQPKPGGVRRSRYAMRSEAGAWERGSGSLGTRKAGASHGASPSGSVGTRKKPRVRSCQQHREWTNEPGAHEVARNTYLVFRTEVRSKTQNGWALDNVDGFCK